MGPYRLIDQLINPSRGPSRTIGNMQVRHFIIVHLQTHYRHVSLQISLILVLPPAIPAKHVFGVGSTTESSA